MPDGPELDKHVPWSIRPQRELVEEWLGCGLSPPGFGQQRLHAGAPGLPRCPGVRACWAVGLAPAAVGMHSLVSRLPRAALTFRRANVAFGACWASSQPRREALNATWCFPFSTGLCIFTGKPKRQHCAATVGAGPGVR